MAPKKTMQKLRALFGLAAAEAFLIAAILNSGTGEFLRLFCDVAGIGIACYLVALTLASRGERPADRQEAAPLPLGG
ncbi:MAG: hypothetical protein JWL84_3199 [Rhodospirillales bacterium]|jgi:hypothetical protein|nr:hypothetical protein [Rhodospirillales bacterium]